jgi:hypothetical protein
MEKELTGRAYGFIECYAQKNEFESSLKEAIVSVRGSQSPKKLEVKVTEGVNPDIFRSDSELHQIAVEARDCGRIQYTIEASSEMNNYETGLELGTTIAQSAMVHPDWYGKNGQTWSRIVYNEGREYMDIE